MAQRRAYPRTPLDTGRWAAPGFRPEARASGPGGKRGVPAITRGGASPRRRAAGRRGVADRRGSSSRACAGHRVPPRGDARRLGTEIGGGPPGPGGKRFSDRPQQAAEKGPSAALARSRDAATYGPSTPPTHLRWVPRASHAALHLGLFEQPGQKRVFQNSAKPRAGARPWCGRSATLRRGSGGILC
jgi:hypothetical protein